MVERVDGASEGLEYIFYRAFCERFWPGALVIEMRHEIDLAELYPLHRATLVSAL